VLAPPRRTETSSRSLALPGKESRRTLEDLPLLAQHPILPLQLAQPLSLLAGQDVPALTAIRLVLAQPVYAASAPNSPTHPPTASPNDHPTATTGSPPAETPADTAAVSLASPLLPRGHPRKHRRCQPDRVNSTSCSWSAIAVRCSSRRGSARASTLQLVLALVILVVIVGNRVQMRRPDRRR
jgi:hypothetical protein